MPQMLYDWTPTMTQIVLGAPLVPILSLRTTMDHVCDKHVPLVVVSEAMEVAPTKGYSDRTGVRQLVGVFWQLALQLRCSAYIDRVPPMPGHQISSPEAG